MSKKDRERMVREQIERRGIDDERLLEAMRRVPREEFVPDKYRSMAYRDGPVPIGKQQTISQPYVVAVMTRQLQLEPGDRVLEIGTGSGYQAAILAELDAEVYTIERHEELVERVEETFRELEYTDIQVRCGDGSKGWKVEAPFDAILVTAAAPSVPQSLLEQLDIGGRLVIPVDDDGPFGQQLVRITRTGDDEYDREKLGEVAFVPLIGDEGWDKDRRIL